MILTILIKNIDTYSPEHIGKKDILTTFDKIAYISEKIDLPSSNFPETEIIDGSKLKAIPGIIDLHVHITGGGGEGGFTVEHQNSCLHNLLQMGLQPVLVYLAPMVLREVWEILLQKQEV